MSETTLIAQLGVVVVAAQVVGRIFRAIGQPQVMGEMLAGILLGPSLLGWIAPGASSSLFPDDSIPLLGALSQVGLVLFLFVIGLKHDPATLRGHGRTAVAVSITSLAVPFALGVLLALVLHAPLSEGAAGVTELALFLGTAMSITAFPVLARIVVDRGLLGTTIGALALVCAAVNDVVGWLLMAAVLLVVGAGGVSPWLAVLGTVLYAVLGLPIERVAVDATDRPDHRDVDRCQQREVEHRQRLDDESSRADAAYADHLGGSSVALLVTARPATGAHKSVEAFPVARHPEGVPGERWHAWRSGW